MNTAVFGFLMVLALASMAPPAGAQGSSIGQKVDDAAITAKVKAKLVAERAGNLVKINVDTDNGVVRLRGTVPTDGDKARAQELARLTDGVRSVMNELTVEGMASAGREGPSASPSSAFIGRHTMSGEVTDVDATHGRVKVRTSEGELQLHFPPSTLSTLKRGDHVTVDLGVRREP